MRFLISVFLTTLLTPALADTDISLDHFEASRDVLQNPEKYISQEVADRLRKPGEDKELQAAAKSITEETHKRVDEELQRLKFDEQNWVFERDADAEVKPGAGLGKKYNAQSALGVEGEIRYVVYLSLGMPDQEFREAIKAIKSNENAFGAIRGLAEKDHTIPDTMRQIHKRWTALEPDTKTPPLIFLDPTLFSDYGIKAVPTIIRFDGTNPTVRAEGMLNIDWVERQFENDRVGDLGQQGPIYDISEEPFMETIKRRMEKLDTEQMQQDAYDNFWSNQRFTKLPTAEETASYQVDLTFTVQKDIQLPNGKYLAKKGKQINPLEIMPFQRIGVVFDPTKPGQSEWARKEAERAKKKGVLPILMITDLDTSQDGWEAFRSLNNSIPGFAVKMANSPILDRFQVEKVPSRFEQDGNYIRVTEFAKEDY